MQYMGGKARIAKELVQFMQPVIDRSSAYVESFVGGGNVLVRVRHPDRRAYDASVPLITMWRAVQSGLVPPTFLSEGRWRRLKRVKDCDNPMTAFAGFGCSFGGKYFQGYARGDRNYADTTARGLLRDAPYLEGVKFQARDYRDVPIPRDSFVYCDPPYRNTMPYGGVGRFDHEEFWDWVRWASRRAVIVVSELEAPSDFRTIWSRNKTRSMDGVGGNTFQVAERLFHRGLGSRFWL